MTAAEVLFGCLVFMTAWCAALTVVGKGALTRLDRAEATVDRQREALTEAAQTIANAGLRLPDRVEAWLAEMEVR